MPVMYELTSSAGPLTLREINCSRRGPNLARLDVADGVKADAPRPKTVHLAALMPRQGVAGAAVVAVGDAQRLPRKRLRRHPKRLSWRR